MLTTIQSRSGGLFTQRSAQLIADGTLHDVTIVTCVTPMIRKNNAFTYEFAAELKTKANDPATPKNVRAACFMILESITTSQNDA